MIAPALSGQTDRRRGLAAVSVMLATIMQAVDTTIANVALPHMQGALGGTQDQIAWVLTSYIVAAAICMPLTGLLAARFGRKRVFMTAVAGFTVASMLCGAAQNLSQIVLFRLMQGVFGACLVPLSQAVMLDSYPPHRRASAMALWGMGVMVGPIVGPMLGGWLTEHYNWRWVFYINLPVGLLAWFGMAAYLQETPIDRTRRFDLFGFTLLGLALGSLQMMLDRGHSLGWFDSPEVIAEALLAGLAAYLFLVHTITHKQPFIDPVMFRDRNFATGLVLIFIIGVMLLATMALLPPFLQSLMGYPVVDVGLLLAGASLWQMTLFTTDIGAGAIVSSGVVQGLGLGLIFAPLSNISFATLAPRYRNEGTAIYSLVRSIGSSVGISLVITYLAQQTQANHAALAGYIDPLRLAVSQAVETGTVNLSTTQGLMAIDAEVMRQAATLAYLQDFRLMMWITLSALPLILLLRPVKRVATSAEPSRSKTSA
jgi:DHA2 family multidrug resistance protein